TMDETAIRAQADGSDVHVQGAPSPPTPATPAAPEVPDLSLKSRQTGFVYWVKKVLSPLASLRLTVVRLALGILLIFFGTLALMDEGLYSALHNYFRCYIAWIPLQLFVRFGHIFLNIDQKVSIGGGFYFPGGWLIGAILLVNVLA